MNTSSNAVFRTSAPQAADRGDWEKLYTGYAVFYGTELTPAIAERVWGWLLDADHVLEGLLAHDAAGQCVGLIHIRACPHPLSGSTIGFVDDMYVAESARGSGVADALVDGLARLAQIRGWQRVRWVTQHYNARGRALYDRVTGGPSDFIMYNWANPASRKAPST